MSAFRFFKQAALLAVAVIGLLHAAPRDEEWGKVKEATDQDQLQTAIELLSSIEKAAFAERAWAEGARALATRIALESEVEGKPAAIKKLEASIETAPEKARPVLRVLAANWMCGYYYENRWRFMGRSSSILPPPPGATRVTDLSPPGQAAPADADMESWDLARILSEIDGRLQKSLADAAALKKIPVAEFADLLTTGALGDAVRPTFYDFAASIALGFYGSDEVGASRPADDFGFAAESPALGTAEEFLAWKPELGDGTSPKARALRIYQDLLTYHRGDADKSAFLNADLARIHWAGEMAAEEGREARLEKVLRRFAEVHAAHPASAMARAYVAQILQVRNELKDAHVVLREGAAAFPEHPYGKLCASEIAGLERSELQLQTDSNWTPAGDAIHVQYRNLKQLWFRLYPAKYSPDRESPDGKQVRSLARGKPAREWGQMLREEGDYRQQRMKIAAPVDMPPGYYYLIASAREDFSDKDNVLAITGVHVTTLAIVGGEGKGDRVEGTVVDAVSGVPQPGVEVTVWKDKPEGEGRLKFEGKTGDDGRFEIGGKGGSSFVAVARRGEERAVLDGYRRGGDEEAPKKHRGVVFFTDRAIYRPGQTVHFKGIWCEIDPVRGKYAVVPDRKGTVVMEDENDKELGKLEVKSSKLGSFSGGFTAPEGSLLGACTIRLEGESGNAFFHVEEYKRPKFFAEIDPPQDAAVLGKQVTVRLRAEAYTGAAVDGAKVSWSVSRGSEFSGWWQWRGPGGRTEIAHGETLTDASGAANISFTAKPDEKLREDMEPVFVYTVSASVTDRSGETRTASRYVRVARTALRAELRTDAWLEASKKLEIHVTTTSLDGEGRPAKGTLKIQRLKEPAACPRAPDENGSRDEEGPDALSPDPDRWAPGEEVDELAVETDKEGKATLSRPLKAGAYRLSFETKDANGRPVRAIRGIQVVAPANGDFPTKMPFYTATPAAEVEPGKDAEIFWGSGYPQARACVEWWCDGRLLKREWSQEGRTQQLFRLPVKEEYRGGISVTVWEVALNRLMKEEDSIDVPWSNKELKLRWEHMVSKLQPGAQETWTAVIEAPGDEAAAAEMVATLYDASLDAYLPHGFSTLASLLRSESDEHPELDFGNKRESLDRYFGFKQSEILPADEPFRSFREELEIFRNGGIAPPAPMSVFSGGGTRDSADYVGGVVYSPVPGGRAARGTKVTDIVTAGLRSGDGAINRNNIDAVLGNPNRTAGAPGGVLPEAGGAGKPDLGKVAARANLQETAFFFPDLVSAADGKVRLSFTMPEALTKWRFLGMAHDKQMRSGFLAGETVTAKDLMVQPNPPRFLREGDELCFTVKISNRSDKAQEGVASLNLMDAATEADRNVALGLTEPEQKFTVAAKESCTLKWRIAVPDGAGFLRYKAVASTGEISDGEEGWLPVIPRRILVTESMSMPVREEGKKDFEFTKLLQSGGSNTLESRFLHVQVVSRPAWYAVMALPYLMEFPHECAEQTFSRYYANALGRHIAASDPKIRRTFEQWKAGGGALDSPLTKNADLKGVLLDETPWLAEAKDESEARRSVGLLFDDNRMGRESEKTLEKLKAMQLGNGLWPWFPGGSGDEYITLYIATGFARLRALGVATDIEPALKALGKLDAGLTERYEDLRKAKLLDKRNLDSHVALYLYTRTFFLKDKALEAKDKVAFDYFTGQARAYWKDLGRMSRAHAALGLKRLGDKAVPELITRSLKETAVNDPELGMHWKDGEGEGWWWWVAPIETQAMMIEAFREIDHDDKAVDDCQVWLIKQKQVQDWKTTKATADAVYALLMGGKSLLSSNALLKVSLAGQELKPEKVEAGTGFYEARLTEAAVKPELGKIQLEKSDKGVAWASVHWQYLEDMAKVTPHEGTPLKLEKVLFIRKNTDKGPVLEPLVGPAKVGDELVSRVILKNDRAMEYVHLKDLRGSGTEPVNVLSGYRWQDDLGYYEVTRDTASHFFIDQLPAGTHVFETSVRVQQSGKYQTGIAEIRCMYAPEFNAHSGSVEIVVE